MTFDPNLSQKDTISACYILAFVPGLNMLLMVFFFLHDFADISNQLL